MLSTTFMTWHYRLKSSEKSPDALKDVCKSDGCNKICEMPRKQEKTARGWCQSSQKFTYGYWSLLACTGNSFCEHILTLKLSLDSVLTRVTLNEVVRRGGRDYRYLRSKQPKKSVFRDELATFNNRVVLRHFDRSKTPSFLTFSPRFSFTGLSWVLVSAVTKFTRSDQWFFSYILGNFRGFGLQSYFQRHNWDIYSAKKSKSMMWHNTQWTRVFNVDIYPVTLNDLEHVT